MVDRQKQETGPAYPSWLNRLARLLCLKKRSEVRFVSFCKSGKKYVIICTCPHTISSCSQHSHTYVHAHHHIHTHYHIHNHVMIIHILHHHYIHFTSSYTPHHIETPPNHHIYIPTISTFTHFTIATFTHLTIIIVIPSFYLSAILSSSPAGTFSNMLFLFGKIFAIRID